MDPAGDANKDYCNTYGNKPSYSSDEKINADKRLERIKITVLDALIKCQQAKEKESTSGESMMDYKEVKANIPTPSTTDDQ